MESKGGGWKGRELEFCKEHWEATSRIKEFNICISKLFSLTSKEYNLVSIPGYSECASYLGDLELCRS